MALVVVGVLYYQLSKDTDDINVQDSPNTETGDVVHGCSSDEIAKWSQHESEQLGVSLRYPKTDKGGELIAFNANNILFVTHSESSINTNRKTLEGLNSDMAILDQAQEFETNDTFWPNTSWKVWVQEVESEADISNIIQTWFGERHGFGNGCKFNGLVPSFQPDVYDVQVGSVNSTGDLTTDSCFVNWQMGFKYSPTYKKVAIWDIGQEQQFFLSDDVDPSMSCIVDSVMSDSFQFIQ